MTSGALDDGYKWPSSSHTHPMLYMEYWYFNFTDPETGVGGIIGFGVVNPADHLGLGRAAVVGSMFDGEGGATAFDDLYPIEDFSAHVAAADVEIGKSGKLTANGTDHIRVRARSNNGEVQVDLEFKRAASQVMIPPGQGPTSWSWNRWLIYMPSACVSGTVTVKGKQTMITQGGGYHDHSWGAWPLPLSTWAWAVWSAPTKKHAGVIGYHCAFNKSQAFVLVPHANGGQQRVDFEESTMVFTPKQIGSWLLFYKRPTEVSFEAYDSTREWRIDVTWRLTATANLWRSPVIIFESACTFEGGIYRKSEDGRWECYQPLNGVPGHSESVDTWWGSGALNEKGSWPGGAGR
ncbi:MAG: hypothetical protein OXU20_24095 [Myxococcales bacterium]|nr:hypothetical protein [Myxococcales bacterium]